MRTVRFMMPRVEEYGMHMSRLKRAVASVYEVFGSPGLEKHFISGNRKKDEFILNESRNNSAFVPLTDFTSETFYSEKIGTVYAQFKSKIGKLGYQIGLRVENTNIDIDFRSAQEESWYRRKTNIQVCSQVRF